MRAVRLFIVISLLFFASVVSVQAWPGGPLPDCQSATPGLAPGHNCCQTLQNVNEAPRPKNDPFATCIKYENNDFCHYECSNTYYKTVCTQWGSNPPDTSTNNPPPNNPPPDNPPVPQQCGQACTPVSMGGDPCPLDCPSCSANNGGVNVCQTRSERVPTATKIPTKTPTATPGPQCGEICNPQLNGICPTVGAGKDCSVCVPNPNNTETGICSPPKLQCGQVCNPLDNRCPTEDEAGCPECVPATSGGSAICRGPAQCACDSIDIEGKVEKGQTVKVTAYAKIENPATNPAKTRDMIFHIEKDGKEISGSPSTAVPAVLLKSPDPRVTPGVERYASSFSFKITESGSYRVWVKINCTYKYASALANDASQQNIFGRIASFFGNILSGRSNQGAVIQSEPQTQEVASNNIRELVPQGQQSLQLGTWNMVTPTLTPTITLTPSPTPTVPVEVRKECTQLFFTIP